MICYFLKESERKSFILALPPTFSSLPQHLILLYITSMSQRSCLLISLSAQIQYPWWYFFDKSICVWTLCPWIAWKKIFPFSIRFRTLAHQLQTHTCTNPRTFNKKSSEGAAGPAAHPTEVINFHSILHTPPQHVRDHLWNMFSKKGWHISSPQSWVTILKMGQKDVTFPLD